MRKTRARNVIGILMLSLVISGGIFGCSTEKTKNKAKEAAARYWQDKAYPGKSYDVQVTEAEKADGGMYRVKGIVDGETRTGLFNPDTENFSEGYYSMAQEKGRRVAELEQESKYWKEKSEALDKENFKLKIQLKMVQGKKLDDDDSDSASAPAPAPEKK